MSRKGRIHSLETFGTVDGPGIRFVLFMQGCLMKCQYCHNPDTWHFDGGREVTVEEVLAEIEPYIHYYRSSGGGLTISGGEPTLQAGFVTEVFREVKARWALHTTLDSNGFNNAEKLHELMDVTDLVLLDIKHIDDHEHRLLTGVSNEQTLHTAKWLSDHGKKMWVRHVFVPGIHDREEHLRNLGKFIGTLQGVEKFEILPYHQMGIYKWKELGRTYPLENVPSPTEQQVEWAYRMIESGRLVAHTQ